MFDAGTKVDAVQEGSVTALESSIITVTMLWMII